MKKTLGWLGVSLVGLCLAAAGAETDADSLAPDPYAEVYQGYNVGWGPSGEMKLSSEPRFFTLNLVSESDRAYALVKAAKEKEHERQFREAMEIYQMVIDKYPETLYRVSEFGVFVPIAHYCQLRLLGFPSDALRAYRVKYDPRAKEAYELAAQKNSLEGLAQVRDSMLATSYGSKAMLALGGQGNLIGPVVGAAVLIVIPEIFRFLQEYRMFVYGTILIVMMLVRRQGILGGREYSLRLPWFDEGPRVVYRRGDKFLPDHET